MARSNRIYVSKELGSYHIINRVVGRQFLLGEAEKEHYLYLLQKFVKAFFIELHSFCIMDNHVHLLITGLDEQAENASWEELLSRYRILYGPDAMPPSGSADFDGSEIPDPDYGIERLRSRLGSVSRFMQELQQTFSRWYNERHNRVGYFWSSRFKSVLTSRDEGQLICATYIDLNPIRAKIVQRPDDYRWCTLGILARNPSKSTAWITPIPILEEKEESCWNWYRVFVYHVGAIEKPNAASIPLQAMEEIEKMEGRLNLSTRLSYRVKSLSEGLAIGAQTFVESIQKRLKRKIIKARSCLQGAPLYTTRSLGPSG